MDSKLLELWEAVIEKLQNNNLTVNFITEHIEPHFNYLIFKSYDHTKNSLLNYAIIYKNIQFVEFIFQKINYDFMENELKILIAHDLFTIFIHQTSDLKNNLSFLLKFIETLRKTSFKNALKVYLENDVNFVNFMNKKNKEIIESTVEERVLIAERKANKFLESIKLKSYVIS